MVDRARTDTGGAIEALAPLRQRLDEVDGQILDLLVRRMEICMDVARTKAERNIPMMQTARVSHVVGRAREHATLHGLPAEYFGGLYERIVEETCAHENVLIAAMRDGDAP